MILQPLKPTLKGAKFNFDYPYDKSMLLTHLEQKLLPICDNCRSYGFFVDFWCNPASSAKKLISSILQFDQIYRCSNVLINFKSFVVGGDFRIELPVDVVANWLNRSRTSNAINANGQMKVERILAIEIGTYIYNVSEMLDCLKKVKSNHLINLIT